MAGNNIKGITIDIGGNTQPLNKALSEANKTSRNLQNELKQVDKLLKLDPKNTELLAQKQKLLSEQITNTSSKLDTLKEAEKQVQEQFERGEVSEEQYRALQREVIKTEQELSELEAQAKLTADNLEILGDGAKHSAEEIENAKKEASEYGEKLKNLGEKSAAGVAAVGSAIVAAGGYAVKFNSEYDSAFNNFIAKTGIATDESEKFEVVMQNIYKNNYGEDINDVALAMATVAQNARNTDPSNIEKMTVAALTLRDTFEYDVSESMRAANMLIDQFGLSGEEAFNLIAQGAQGGLDKNGDLLDSINEYSVHFKQLGLDAEEMFNSFLNGANSGTFSVDKLGDAVKEFGIRVKDNSDGTKTALSDLNLNADELTKKFAEGGEAGKQAFNEVTSALFAVDDKVKQNEIGVALFGSMWEDLGIEGVKALTDINGGFDKTKATLEEINNVKYDDLQSAFGGLKRTIELDVVQPIGESLTPTVNEIINTVKENAPSIKSTVASITQSVFNFANWMLNNGQTIGLIITMIGTAMLTWNAVSIVHSAVQAFKAFKIATEGATVAQWLYNTALNANPIGIVITAVTALVAAIIYLWNTSDGFQNFFVGLWKKIKAVFSGAGKWFGDIFSNAWQKVKSVFSSWGSFFSGLWDKIKSTFSSLGTSIANAIGGAVKSGINGVISMIQNTINGAIKLINGAIGLINKIPGVKVGTIKTLSLPRLATGTVLTKATPVVAGEDGAEAIMPLEKHTEWIDVLARRLNIAMNGTSGSARNTMQEIINNLGGINLNIDKFENNTDKDLHQIMGELMEIAEEYIKRRGGAFA